jgi:hypothetical protein
MTKFEELCEIYTQSGKEFIDYRWKCIDFVVLLGEGVAEYLECSKDEIQYYIVSKQGPPQESHPRDALFLENDTFWHYGMGINLYMEGIKNPGMTYIFNIALKEEKNRFIVEFLDQQKEFTVNSKKPEDLHQIYELIFETIKSRFENELEKFLKHKSPEHFPGYI